jgi:hypothetical protein
MFSATIDSSFGLAVADYTDITQTLERISTSMTYALAQGQSGEKVKGQAISTEQYILVHWP